jgi:hypothetical protein
MGCILKRDSEEIFPDPLFLLDKENTLFHFITRGVRTL